MIATTHRPDRERPGRRAEGRRRSPSFAHRGRKRREAGRRHRRAAAAPLHGLVIHAPVGGYGRERGGLRGSRQCGATSTSTSPLARTCAVSPGRSTSVVNGYWTIAGPGCCGPGGSALAVVDRHVVVPARRRSARAGGRRPRVPAVDRARAASAPADRRARSRRVGCRAPSVPASAPRSAAPPRCVGGTPRRTPRRRRA